jgi:hypothetical protein
MSDQAPTPPAAQPKLLVFLHVPLKQLAFQSELQAALPGVTVTAVGRVADFDRGLREGQDAVLSLPVVLAAHGLAPTTQGTRKGSATETYSLAAVDVTPDPQKISTLGVLDLLGREGMNAFVMNLVGVQPKIERVTKLEDLLPLLQMQRVNAVILPTRLVSELKNSSRLNLIWRELPKGVLLPAIATTGARGAGIVQALHHLPSSLSAALGVSEWR